MCLFLHIDVNDISANLIICFDIFFHRALYLNMPFFILFTGLLAVVGVLAVAYFGDCDPLLSRRIGAPDQVLHVFLHKRMHSVTL